jgi:hypothetical protein
MSSGMMLKAEENLTTFRPTTVLIQNRILDTYFNYISLVIIITATKTAKATHGLEEIM